MDLNELKNEQIKEDKIEKLIESFQRRVSALNECDIQFHRKVEKRHEKEETFSMRKTISCLRNSSNSREQTIVGSSSEKEHRANALASGAEEGRDKLR